MRFGLCIWEILNILVVTELPNPSINPQNFLMAVANFPFPMLPPLHFNLTACKVMIYTRFGPCTQPHFKLALSGESQTAGEKSFCSVCLTLYVDRLIGAKCAEKHAKEYRAYFSVLHCIFFAMLNCNMTFSKKNFMTACREVTVGILRLPEY